MQQLPGTQRPRANVVAKVRQRTAVGLIDRDGWVWRLRYFASFLASLRWHEVGHLATH